MLTDLELDHDGIAAFLKSRPVQEMVHAAAERVGSNVEVDAEDGVAVDDYTTDRAASSVTIRDARGKLWQTRDGALTRAAAAAGLEVTER